MKLRLAAVAAPFDRDLSADLARIERLVAAAAFVFPSTKEGFGLAAMEALAAGIPLMVSDLPVFRELFGSVALFGPSLTSAMRSALTVPDPERIQAGRSLAAGYTWKAAAQRHLSRYSSLT